jgi:hypothetical protein
MSIYMEDLNQICADAVTDIEMALADHDIQLSENQLDLLWDKLQNEVEKLAGCPDYRNYN